MTPLATTCALLHGLLLPGSLFSVLALSLAGTILIALIVMAVVLKTCLVSPPPGRLAVVSGRSYRRPDGTVVGYRLLQGGRTLRLPGLEQVQYLDLTSQYVPVALRGAFSQDGTRLDVEVAADVRITTDPSAIYNAVERFLGADPKVLPMVATETLEGAIRATIAETTDAEAQRDHELVAQRIMANVLEDLGKLGLMLDMLTIVNVQPAA